MSDYEQLCLDPGCSCRRDPEELKVKVIEVTVDEPVVIQGPVIDNLSDAVMCHWVGDGAQGRLRDDCPHICECGKLEGSFACKIRHVQLNTGWAKSAND